MKKTTTLLGFLALTSVGFAQSPRMSLYEEFTGENCPPCASTNPGLDVKLAANSNNTIPLKWQVAIPSAPTSPTSLYQQNKTEIDARDAYYSISSAPSGRQDGQNQTVFGATSDHPGYITATILNNAAAVTSPFTIDMTRTWDATFSTITCTGTITATGNYTTTGTNLKFRLVMTEKEIIYATAPGSNGEKEFHYVARKSFPDLANGTAMANTWTTGQTQTFTVVCTLPSYIWDKSQVEMVGFIQDDANKKVLQSVLGAASPLQDDAKAVSASIPAITCSNSLTPTAVIKNNGSNVITSMVIDPYVNGVANGASVNWAGSLAVGASTTITFNPVTGLTSGAKTFSANISSVNGTTDFNLGNNNTTQKFSVIGAYLTTPVAESFSATTYPPTNWILVNPDGGTATWSRVTSTGSQSTTQSSRYNAYNAPAGDVDELFLPPINFTGFTAAALNFDVASAAYSSSSPENDQLQVMVSTDCGTTWATVYDKAGATLNTAPTTTANFVPTGSQWRAESVNLNAYAGNATVLVKFVATSDYGNNIYVDQVNLAGGTVGIQEENANFASVELYPNPTVNETSVNISLVNSSEVAVSVLNNVGQLVYQTVATLNAGNNKINLDTKNYAAGIYNVVISSENGAVTKKLSVTK